MRCIHLDRCFWHTWNGDRFVSDKNRLNRFLIIIILLIFSRAFDSKIIQLTILWIEKWKTMTIDFGRSLRIDFLSIGSPTWNLKFFETWIDDLCLCAIHSHGVNQMQTLNQTESKRKRWKWNWMRKRKHQQRKRSRGVQIMDYFWMLDIYFSFFRFFLSKWMASGEKMGWHTNTRQNEFVEKQLNNAHTQHHCKSHSLAHTLEKGDSKDEKWACNSRDRERVCMTKRTYIFKLYRWMRIPLTKTQKKIHNRKSHIPPIQCHTNTFKSTNI